MSDDVAMTTSRLSVQPGFGIFRRAASGTQTVWVFNLLSERKQAAVSDGIMGGWGGGWGGAWVRVRCVGRDYKVRHQLNLCLRAQTWEMKKVVGVITFFFSCVLLPSQSSNGKLQRYERDKQTD